MKVYMHGEQLEQQMRATKVPQGCLAIWNLGQASALLQGPLRVQGPQTAMSHPPTAGTGGTFPGTTVLIDPYLTRSMEIRQPDTEFVREYDAPITPEQLAGVTVVLITHHHDDHLDIDTLIRLHAASPSTTFVVPAPHVHLLTDANIRPDVVIAATAGEKLTVGEVSILPVAAAHTTYETDEKGEHLYLGYVVNVGDVLVYHSGDTVVTDKLLSDLDGIRPQIAMLPINGQDYFRSGRNIVGNMGMRDAVQLALRIRADMLWPNHYDMFPNNRENPAFMVDYIFQQHRHLKFHMAAVGERFIYLAD
jgi:L-ascorbate 6-phosphate lactonase